LTQHELPDDSPVDRLRARLARVARWLCIILSACICMGFGGCAAPIVRNDADVPSGDATISVVARGWHTDVALPVDDSIGPLTRLRRDFPGVHFLVFGFGERAYLMTRHAGSGEALGALFPSRSAILATALLAPPAQAFADQQVVTLRLNQDAVKRIAALIWQSLEHDAHGNPVRLADGPYDGSAFYASAQTYDAFHTCNTWTAQLLRDGGFPVQAGGVLFSGQLMGQVMQIAALQAQRAR
jgi:uncharacterized protein (TIGR02117 family)